MTLEALNNVKSIKSSMGFTGLGHQEDTIAVIEIMKMTQFL